MDDRRYGEKQEKEDEKRNEKSWQEKYRRDPLGSLTWAMILIWVGVVMLIDNLNLLDQLGITFLADMEIWSLITGGAGLIILAVVVVRLLVPEYRTAVTGNIIFGFILLGIAFGDTVGWGVIWPLVLIGIGIAYLLGGFRRKS